MPYEYRKMTPRQRKEVLELRRQRGYPLHAPPHPVRHAGLYLVSAANFEHTPVMAAPERRREFEGDLLEAMKDCQAEVRGWVVLPNHYHLVVTADSMQQLSSAVKKLHGRTARRWNLADGKTGTRQVWYRFRDDAIRGEGHFYKVLNYVHYNPVKHGYVNSPYDWAWSSVHDYFDTHGREWLRAKWVTHSPGDFGKGWDD